MIKYSEETTNFQFNKGLVTYPNFFALTPQQTPASLNTRFGIDGSIIKRLGTSTMNTVALAGTNAYGMYDYGITIGGNDSAAKMLLHLDTDFIDSSDYLQTVTTSGTISLDGTIKKWGIGSAKFGAATTLDYMEYATDVAAQAAYVTDAAEGIDQQFTSGTNDTNTLENSGGVQYRAAQSFQLSGDLTISAVEVQEGSALIGSPSGNWTLRIETSSGGLPSGNLANANASVVVAPPGLNTIVKGTFATQFTLSGSTTYWLVINCPDQSAGNGWKIKGSSVGGYGSGNAAYSEDGTWYAQSSVDLNFKVYTLPLQCYSEATIINQGTYSLKGFAVITNSLNDTLTRTVSPTINLSGMNTLTFDIYASRTGANIKVGIHDSGGYTSEKTYTVIAANTWETVTWDISAVGDANKDVIDSIIITVIDADAANTFYIDNFFSSSLTNTSGYLSVADSDDFYWGGDYTIDGQVDFNNLSTRQVLLYHQNSNADYHALLWHDSLGVCYEHRSANVLHRFYHGRTGDWTADTFYHFMFAKSSTTHCFYKAGSLIASSAMTLTATNFTSPLLIGVEINTAGTYSSYFRGHLDELRVSKGVARNTGNTFDEPTEEYGSTYIQNRRLICARGTGGYYSSDLGKTWIVNQTGRNATYNHYSFVKNYIINTNDKYDKPQYWAGSANSFFQDIGTNPPLCRFSCSHQGYLVLLNQRELKRNMYYVDQNTMFSTAFSSFQFPTARNDECCGGFVMHNFLYVSTKYKIFRMIYVGGAPDWSYYEIKGFGYIPETIRKVNIPQVGEVIIGLDWDKHIRIFDGTNDVIVSNTIEQDNGLTPFYIDNINEDALPYSWAENDTVAQVYRLFVGYGTSTTISHCVDYDYRTGSLYVDDNRNFGDGILASGAADNLNHMMAGDYNGYIHHIDSGNKDVTTPVNDYYISPLYYRQTPSKVTRNQQIDLFFKVTSSGTLYYEDRGQFSNVWNLRKTFTLGDTIEAIQIRQTIDIPESYNVYQFKISSSSNTANPWQLNLVDLSNSELGVGKP